MNRRSCSARRARSGRQAAYSVYSSRRAHQSKQYRAAYRLLGALSQGTSDARVQLLHGLVGQKLKKSNGIESILNALNLEMNLNGPSLNRSLFIAGLAGCKLAIFDNRVGF